MPIAAGVCSIGDSARRIFKLACWRAMERNWRAGALAV